MTTKIVYIGSCLSARIVDELLNQKAEFTLIGGLPHMRLDALCEYLIDGAPLGAPESVGVQIAKQTSPEFQKHNLRRILSQTSAKLQRIKNLLTEANCLIVDNNYDLRTRLFSVSHEGRMYRFVNLIPEPETNIFQNLGLMPIEGANAIYQKLFDYVRELNPSIQIIFLQFPVTGFQERGMKNARIPRARQMSACLRIDGVHLFPLITIPKEGLTSKGPLYFTRDIYLAYVRAIRAIVEGRKVVFPVPDPVSLEVPYSAFKAAAGANESDSRKGAENPYSALPTRNFWKPAVGDRYPLSISDLYDKKFPISPNDGVATSGSCFAQHIGRRLKTRGFKFLDVEPAPATLAKKEHTANGYGIYSGRYGNIYTSTQLLQLFQRAFKEVSFDEVWESDGRYYDPFRPNLQPGGFSSASEVLEEQNSHLSAVQQLFKKLDVLVFTMGLTECWYNARTSAVYPISPGVTAGRFDPDIHKFKNLTFVEIMQDMTGFLERLKTVNPDFRMLLTVSPVPLTATAENRHVLVSTMHSKSVLRAAAGELAARHDFIDYFPSYEIVMSPAFRGMFFQNNLRTIHDEGVDFVMSHFFAEHHASTQRPPESASEPEDNEDFCDEIFLEVERKITQNAVE